MHPLGRPAGNQNAVGNRGGASSGNQNAVGYGAPYGNKNALKHGLHDSILMPTSCNRLVEEYCPELKPFMRR